MTEKLILMHENTPYFNFFPFLKPLGEAVTPPAPRGAAPDDDDKCPPFLIVLIP